MELEPVVFEQFAKPRHELAAEAAAKCLDGQEEAWRRIDPSGIIGSQAAGGNDVVDMGLMLKGLSPGKGDAEESDVGSQMLRIAGQVRQRRGTGAVRQSVNTPLRLGAHGG